jgi:hypothetical protein
MWNHRSRKLGFDDKGDEWGRSAEPGVWYMPTLDILRGWGSSVG